jgi:tetratricopeptide (TPR) repeat protein
MRTRVLLSIALMSAAPAWAADKPEVGPVPAWVDAFPAPKGKPSPVDPASSLPAEAPVALLRLDQQVRFGADTDERYSETAVKILTPQGLAAMGTVTIAWQPDSMTPIVHKLHIIRDGRTIDVLANGQQFTVLRRESRLESAMLDGVLTATLQPEGLQVGDVLEMAVTIRGRDQALPGHVEELIELPPVLPGTRLHLAVEWPEGVTMHWRRSDALSAIRSVSSKGANHLALTLDSIEPLPAPKGAPPRFAPVRRLELTGLERWSDLSAAMAPLYRKAAIIPAGSTLATEVARIKAATNDPKLRATAALKLVQDQVRYVYRGMNMGNLVPATAAETWERRFGDCKGKTALLLAILSALEISAEPAAVSTTNGDGLDARLPMVGLLDHILVRAEIGGKTYWLDGTRSGDGDLERIAVPAFSWALPVRDGGSALVALVQVPFDRPQTETSIAIDASLGISLPAPFEVTTVMRGDEALGLRQQLATLTGKALDEGLMKYWKGRYGFVTPEKVKASFDEKTGEQKLTMEGKAELEWGASGYELDGASLGWSEDYKREAGPNADAPIAVAFPLYTLNKETITLPKSGEGFTVKGEDVDKQVAGYALSRKTKIVDGQLVMEASTRALRAEIPYADALASVEAMTAIDKVRVYLVAPKDYRETEAEKTALMAKTPKDSQEFVTRGNAYLDADEFDKAIADFDKAVALDTDNAWAFANRGIAYAQKKETDKALDDLDRAAAINPRLHIIYHGRASVLQQTGDIGGAIAALGRAIDLEDGNLWALGRRAALYLNRGDHAAALADADAMLKIQPDGTSGLAMRMRVLTVAQRYTDALAVLDTLEKLAPANRGLDLERAYVLVRMGKAEEARALFAKARSEAGKSANTFNSLCWKQALADFDLTTALADCQSALKLKPNEAAYLDSSAMVLLRMGRFDDAIAYYDRALAKLPDQAASLYGRGIAKLRKGATEAGQADVKAAVASSSLVAGEFAQFGVKP